MSASLKLVSVNVERHEHIGLVEAFLRKEMPDVACLQELMQSDLERLAAACSATATFFLPMGVRPQEGGEVLGLGILSRWPFRMSDARYYVGDPGSLPQSISGDEVTNNAFNRVLAFADVEKDGASFRLVTTHFSWSPRGEATPRQRLDMKAMLQMAEGLGEFVLCGDFNTPRGGEMFSLLAEKYKDNIPARYKTSLDLSLHRAGKSHAAELADKMVDGLFSSPAYAVSGVEFISGVSDHCAVVATVSKTG